MTQDIICVISVPFTTFLGSYVVSLFFFLLSSKTSFKRRASRPLHPKMTSLLGSRSFIFCSEQRLPDFLLLLLLYCVFFPLSSLPCCNKKKITRARDPRWLEGPSASSLPCVVAVIAVPAAAAVLGRRGCDCACRRRRRCFTLAACVCPAASPASFVPP